MVDLTISIINYKTKKLTSDCLESILQKKWQISYDIWLVDNASQDGSIEYFKKKYPKINIIESKKNLGFAGGHNLVLNKAKSKYYLILNSDTKVLDQVLDEMVYFMDQHPQCGISSCKILGFDNKLQPSSGDLPIGMALFNWLFNLEVLGIKSTFHRNDENYYKHAHEVGWVSGNFMMIGDEVLTRIGLFNEDYFMYFEDVELCFRIKKEGFKVMINPNSVIKHLSGGSLDHPHLRQWSGEYKGLIKFYRQQYGELLSFIIRLLVYLSTILRIIAFTLTGKFGYSITYAKIVISL